MSCYLWSICLSVSFCRLPSSEPLNYPLGQIMTSGQMFFYGQVFQDTGQILCYADKNWKKGNCVSNHFPPKIGFPLNNECAPLDIHPCCFDWGVAWRCSPARQLVLSRWMAPNGLGTPVLCCFLPNYLHPSISALPSVRFWLSVPFVFCPCASIICKIYVSLSILSFDQSGVGIGKICNSLSILFLSYLSANVFHLGFSISMSMRSIRLSKPIERSLLAIETARSVCRSKQS